MQSTIVGGYLHNYGSHAALLALAPQTDAPLTAASKASLKQFAQRLAQHVVALDPDSFLSAGRTPSAAVDVLLGQAYVFNSSVSVASMLQQESKSLGCPIKIVDFVRWGCGGRK